MRRMNLASTIFRIVCNVFATVQSAITLSPAFTVTRRQTSSKADKKNEITIELNKCSCYVLLFISTDEGEKTRRGRKTWNIKRTEARK